jgi:NADH-quinone oxidoreductase subunit L
LGIFVAWYVYQRKPGASDAIERAAGPLYTGSLNKWYVDEIYDVLFVNGLSKGGGAALSDFDRRVVDGGVNGTGWLARLVSRISIWWDTWIVDGAVRLTAFSVKLSSYPVRMLETGSVQSYALVFVIGIASVFGYYWTR